MRKAIKRHRQFEKNFRKRIATDAKLLAQFEDRFRLFLEGVREAPINDHALTGQLAGYRAFSVSGDVRVIYIETEANIIFLDIGTHNQVYGG
jgi:addiction module RelE/StbE family toxin